MKKFFKIACFAMATVLLLACLFACQGIGSGGAPKIGKYYRILKDANEWEYADGGDYIEIVSSTVFKAKSSGSAEEKEGTFTASDGTVTFTYDVTSETATFSAKQIVFGEKDYLKLTDEELVKLNARTIDFETDGGSAVSSVKGAMFDKIYSPSDVTTKNGYVFSGWFIDEERTEKAVFPYEIKGNATIYAKWKKDKGSVKVFNGGKITDENILLVTNEENVVFDNVKLDGKNTSWKLFSDEKRTEEITEKSVAVKDGNNVYYVRTYADGEEAYDYVLTVHKRHAVTLRFYDGETLLCEKSYVTYLEFAADFTSDIAVSGKEITAWKDENGKTFTFGKDGDVIEAVKEIKNESGQIIGYAADFYSDTEPKTYTINYVTDGGVVVRPFASVRFGEEFTLDVPTKTGNAFEYWYVYDGGVKKPLTDEEGRSVEPYGFDGMITVYAEWTVLNYAIDATASDKGAGSVRGGGVYPYGSTVELTAETNRGYTWLGWYDESDELVTEKEVCLVTVGAYDAEYIAKWALITVKTNKEKAGSTEIADAGKTIVPGDKITLNAKSNDGFVWLGWYGEDGVKVSEENSYTLTVTVPDYDAVYTAKWAEVTLKKNIEEAGAVGGLNGKYVVGDEATLTAATNGNYQWVGWYKGDEKVSVGSETDLKITLTATDVEYIAKWKLYNVELKKNIDEAGVLGELPETYLPGERLEIIAETNEGYTFLGWFDESGKKVSHDQKNYHRFIMPENNVVYTAKWSKVNVVKFLVGASGDETEQKEQAEAAGTTTLAGEYSETKKTFFENEGAKATAVTNAGYTWLGWFERTTAEDGTVSEVKVSEGTLNTYTFNMTAENRTIVAKWSRLKLVKELEGATGTAEEIAAASDKAGAVSFANADKTYVSGENTNVYAETSAGYTWLGWYEWVTVERNGTESVELTQLTANEVYAATMSNESRTIIARWSKVTLVSCDENAGNVPELTNKYRVGVSVSAVAETNDGYTFIGWYDGGVLVTEKTMLEIAITEKSVTYEARWIKVSVMPGDEKAGSVSALNGKYLPGEICSVEATTNVGYTFIGWFNGDTKVTTEKTLTFEMPDENRTYEAKWARTEVKSGDEKAGSVTELNETYVDGQTVTVTATTNSGYVWQGWFDENGDKVSEGTSSEFTFVMCAENKSYTAVWTKITIISSDQKGGATDSLGDRYVVGQKLGINAYPNDGYTFVGWFDGENKVSEAGKTEYDFTLGRTDVTLEARWVRCKTKISANNPSAGSVSGVEGATVVGRETTITAVTNDGYTFIGWFDGDVKVSADTSLTYTFTMTEEDKEYVATWEKFPVAFKVNDEFAGSTEEITGATVVGQEISVKATTNPGYTFLGWYKGDELVGEAGNETLVFNLSAEISVYTAKWIVCPVVLETNDEKAGEVGGVEGGTRINQTITVSAKSNVGYVWLGWYENGVKLGESDKFEFVYSFVLTENKRTLTAKWAKIEAVSENADAGSVAVEEKAYVPGDEIVVNAKTNVGYTFVGWYKGEGLNETKVGSTTRYGFAAENKEIFETLKAKWIKVDLVGALIGDKGEILDATLAGKLSGLERAFVAGERATIEAETNDGYTLRGWFDGNGNKVSDSGKRTYSFKMPESNAVYYAFWIENTVSATTELDCESAAGKVALAGSVSGYEKGNVVGEKIALCASINVGYAFLGWYEKTLSSVSGTEQYVYTKISDDFELTCKAEVTAEKRTFVAKYAFVRAESRLGVNKHGNAVGVDSSYFPGDEETVVASNEDGFTFLGWYTEPLRDKETSELVCKELSYTFTVPDKSMAIYARWTERTVDFQAKIDGKIAANFAQYLNVPTGITVAGKNVTISAAPVDGYVWLGWYEDNTLLTKDRNYTFPMPDGENQKTYSARWATKTLSVAVIENGQDKTASPSMGRVTGLENAVSGQDVTLYAETYDNATFTGWYDVNNKLLESGYSYTVRVPEAALTIKAKWIDCPITIGSYTADAGTTNTLGATKVGDTVVLSAKTNEGYTFLGWFSGETKVSEGTSMSYSFTMTTEKRTVTPRWVICPIIVSVDSTCIEGGSVIGKEDDVTTDGEEVSVYASTNDGYTFVGWYVKGNKDYIITTELEYKFTVNYAEYAVYENNRYELIAKWIPGTIEVKGTEGAGSVSVTQQTTVGKKATLTAVGNPGYTWVGWFDESGALIGERAYSVEVTVTEEKVVYNAKWIVCPITVTTENNGGTVSISEKTVVGKNATLTAVSASGFVWLGWFDASDNLIGERAFSVEAEVPESGTVTYKAKWTQCKVTASAVVLSNGVYTESACGKVNVNGGTADDGTVTLTAETVESGYVFLKWIDEEGNKVSDDYTMTTGGEIAKKYRAVWINNPVIVTRNVAEAGSTAVDGSIRIGNQITLRATLNAGYVWLGWYKNGEIATEETEYTLTVTEESAIYTATWLKEMPVAVKRNVLSAGTVTNTFGNVKRVGDKATVTAASNDGYVFVGWFDTNGNRLTAEFTYELTINKETVSVEARWINTPITVRSGDEESGTVGITKITKIGQTATLEAKTNDGYTFVGWFLNGKKVSKETTYSVTVTETKSEYTAKWIKFPVTVVRNDENAGFITGIPSKSTIGQEITLVAETNDGYTFLGWYKGTRKVSDSGKYDYTVKLSEESQSLEARWSLRTFTVTVNDEKAGRVIVPAGKTVYGGKVTLTAETNDGYIFDGWYFGEEKISSGTSCEITVDSDYKNYEARWSFASDILLEKNIPEAGSVRASGRTSDKINLYASVNAGYTFIGWYNGGTLISGDLNCTFDIPENPGSDVLVLTAKWEESTVSVVKSIDEAGEASEITGGTVVGQKITLKATTRPGYAFVGWYRNDVIDPSDIGKTVCEIEVTEEEVVYEARWMVCPVTVIRNDENAGSVSGVDGISIGDEITLAATTNKGYTFVGWYNGDVLLENRAETLTYTVTRAKKEFRAVWSKVTVVSNDEQGGSVGALEGTYVVGETATIKATKNVGYLFEGWYENGVLRSEQADYVITFTSDDTVYEARFVLCTDHEPNANCICVKCGKECHNMDIYCTCIVCGKTAHEIEDCVCKVCGTTVHEVDENCVCRVCGKEVHGSNALGYCMHDENGKTKIYFGSYPQTEIKKADVVTQLNSKITALPTANDSGNWTSYKYRSWTEEEADYMWYIDVMLGNDRYRGVYFTSYRPTSKTNAVSKQISNGYQTKKVYWFKFELIKWTVLSSDGTLAFIASEKVLDSQEYSTSNDNNYMNSSIRAWLNGAFYDRAFGSVQKKNIKVTSVDNGKQSAMNDEANVCENTRDNVYLLSRKEATASSVGSKQYTDYAKIMGIKINYEANAADRLKCEWWTRSPFGNGYDNACIVKISGLANSKADVTQSCTGVVPALRMRLK